MEETRRNRWIAGGVDEGWNVMAKLDGKLVSTRKQDQKIIAFEIFYIF